jgi:hypothetical protein
MDRTWAKGASQMMKMMKRQMGAMRGRGGFPGM